MVGARRSLLSRSTCDDLPTLAEIYQAVWKTCSAVSIRVGNRGELLRSPIKSADDRSPLPIPAFPRELIQVLRQNANDAVWRQAEHHLTHHLTRVGTGDRLTPLSGWGKPASMQVLDGFYDILAIAQEKDSEGTTGMGSGGDGEWGSDR